MEKEEKESEMVIRIENKMKIDKKVKMVSKVAYITKDGFAL